MILYFISPLNQHLTANGNSFKYSYSNGKYGYTVGGIFYPFKKGLEETTLWTNSSPTSNFSAQDVALSEDMNNFNYLKLTFKKTTTDDNEFVCIFPVSSAKLTASGSMQYKMSMAMWNSQGTQLTRNAYYKADVTIHFDSAGVWGLAGFQTYNNYFIPLSIIGMKVD